jgi:hypothetical protein
MIFIIRVYFSLVKKDKQLEIFYVFLCLHLLEVEEITCLRNTLSCSTGCVWKRVQQSTVLL